MSPRHEVLLAAEYLALIDAPPKKDFVVRTIMRRQVNDMLLMSAELVIAGEDTRKAHPPAQTYPLHFRKTYFPGQLHGDPADEYENHLAASRLIPIPPPIGYGPDEFRSCLLPGTSYSRLSPFGVEPPEMNISLAEKLPLAAAAGLWFLVEQAFAQLRALQAGGCCHGDAELHNFIVCPAPIELLPIDFEGAVQRDKVDSKSWESRCKLDLEPILREATFLQCSLGRQRGALADLACDRIGELFSSPDRFRRQIEEQGAV
ncbi:MAG TPA: hypothetical protein VJT73_01940 [Polyangiaceae bacterium]|nr:hypothetical protein [Polyangiaceae bacterium]